MYQVQRNGRVILEADACGIGFVASRKGVADHQLVEIALDLCKHFDHRGAPGHGAGIQIDIPWPLLLDKFPDHAKLIAQRDIALGSFFLPYDAPRRRLCIHTVEEVARMAGADVLQWVDVPINIDALPKNSPARRTMPIVRHALFRRPEGLSNEGWFVCRYLLRLALDASIGGEISDEFHIVSLSNRTLVYKGLAELSKIEELYPDLKDPHLASRFVLFHSRYCTNTATAWRRAQPFWALAHNGEISTIKGNVAWMQAIGQDLLRKLSAEHPSLRPLIQRVKQIICSGGSDTANLDDMVLALMAGGMTIAQSLLAVLPESQKVIGENARLASFNKSMGVYLGACDGPAAVVACDGDHAVAHLDRNGLRPLWLCATKEYALASSELTGTFPKDEVEIQRVLGPGETFVVGLRTGEILINEQVHEEVARKPFETPTRRLVEGQSSGAKSELADILKLQKAFGMTKEDVEVLLEPLIKTGKAAVGSMGDDATISSLLDEMPRRLEDYFALRFAQETSPPVDPIRDAWVFDTSVALGDRSGLWSRGVGPIYLFDERVLSVGELDWLSNQSGVLTKLALFAAPDGPDGIEFGLDGLIDEIVQEDLKGQQPPYVIVLSDRGVDEKLAPLPMLRLVSRLHARLIEEGKRHRVGIVADSGVWDIHHCALLVSNGADAVCPWLGCALAGEQEKTYLKGVRSGFTEAMSMMGVTPASAYCGARLVETVGLDPEFVKAEFPDVPSHFGGIGPDTLNREWLSFHQSAFEAPEGDLVDAGEFRHSKNGRPHYNNAETVRSVHAASGFSKKGSLAPPGSYEAYKEYSAIVRGRGPVTPLDCVQIRPGQPVSIDEVETEEQIAWRFMAPGMSEGALSEPAHRAIAGGMNLLYRYARLRAHLAGFDLPSGIGPIANSGEGGFEKSRMNGRFGNRSIQYAGGRFTITPMTAARASEAEVKFAQGAKPGKGGQLPGKKVSHHVAWQRGCEPGYELVSPPINHNLYSIEDVKLMVESWRHLNPEVNCALKYVATHGIEMVALGGVNAGANRLHLSDGCGGTGAAKRVDQKHAGVPVSAVLPSVHDMLLEEGVREHVELSVDGGVQTGEQALKLMLLGADKVGFGTTLLMTIGCSMLRKCHLAGADPTDPSGKRRLGCMPGVATQDPLLVVKFSGKSKNVARFLLFVAREIRELMAERGIRRLCDVVGRRDLLEKKAGLGGKAAMFDVGSILNAPHGLSRSRDFGHQTRQHMPVRRQNEIHATERAVAGEDVVLYERLTNRDRCVGLAAAGMIARSMGDLGLSKGSIRLELTGAAGHFLGAYMVDGIEVRLKGVAADSCFTASYGGKLVISPEGSSDLAVVGNAFGYGARGGRVFIAGRAGNRFGICLRKNHEGGGPVIVVEGVEANGFQYMTGGTALVIGPTGFNVGSGMTGGTLYILDIEHNKLNSSYVSAHPVNHSDEQLIRNLLEEHQKETGSKRAMAILKSFDPSRFTRVQTCVVPEKVDAPSVAVTSVKTDLLEAPA